MSGLLISKTILYLLRATLQTGGGLSYLCEKDQNQYVACSHEDYLKANRNEVPDRWVKAVERIKT